MDDFISRDALLKDIEYCVMITRDRPTMELRGASKVIGRINAAPAADVKPVVHGRWIESRSVLGTTTGGTTIYYGYECSVCGGLMGRKGDAFCYKCGARMDGDA